MRDDTWLSRTSAWLRSSWGIGLVCSVGSSAVAFVVAEEWAKAALVFAITAAIAIVPGLLRSPRTAATLAALAAGALFVYLAVTYARGLVVGLVTVLMVVFAVRVASNLGTRGRAVTGVVVSAAVVTIVLVAFPAHDTAPRPGTTTATSRQPPVATDTSTEPQPPPKQASASRPPPQCDRDTASGDEGETTDARKNNDERASAIGPMRGAVDVSGATDSANDRDWAFFCVGPGTVGTGARRVVVRFANPDEGYECSDLQAEIKSLRGALVGDPLQPSPGTIATWKHTLRPGGPYGILITDPGRHQCRWALSVGPPGTFVGDSAVAALPCVPRGEQSARIGDGKEREPNDRLDQVDFLAADSAAPALAVTGSVGPEDEDWFSLCVGVREPIEFTLRSTDYVEYERCDDLTLDVLDSSATAVSSDGSESGPSQTLKYTLATDTPYYVRLGLDSGDTACRYRLRVAPAQHLVDAIPVR